jgi:hypothetical protein
LTAVTWLAICVLGPGSIAVFALFLRDVGTVLGQPDRHDEPHDPP